MGKFKRTKLLVDGKIQGTLAVRAALYWGFCLLTLTLMLLCWRVATGPIQPFLSHMEEMWGQFGPVAIASLLLLPIVIVDILRTSNRFAGPMFRLRKSMQRLARGEEIEPIKFREGDFWQDFAEDFNAIAARFGAEKQDAATAQHASDNAADDTEMLVLADG